MYTSIDTFAAFIFLFCKLLLAGVFAVAGIAKLFDLKGSEKAMAGFGLHKSAAKPAAVILPVVELIIAYWLLTPSVAWYGAAGAFLLLVIFIVAMAAQIAKGNTPDCHCFGQIYSKPISAWSVIRNIALLTPALILLWRMNGISLGELALWLGAATSTTENMGYFLGLGNLVLLIAAVFFLRKLSIAQDNLDRRGDTQQNENTAAGGHQHEHNTSPDEGLPIGAPVPDFELPDMDGRTVSFEGMAGGKAALFFFISPTCAPCKALLPEIGKWQEEFAGKIDFIFISSGSVEDNSAKLPQLGGQTVLLQKKKETADLFKAKWTPTAILANAEGMLASRPAAGDAAIRDLIDKVREKSENIDFVENGRGMGPNELKIGQSVPAFQLPVAGGDSVSDSLIKGKKTLALFWGLDCPYCHRMLPEIKEWEKTEHDTQLIVFSSGDAQANSDLGFQAPVLIDERNMIGTELGMFGTPSAVLIDESGKIVSETAIGAEQIWSLIGKRK